MVMIGSFMMCVGIVLFLFVVRAVEFERDVASGLIDMVVVAAVVMTVVAVVVARVVVVASVVVTATVVVIGDASVLELFEVVVEVIAVFISSF